MTSLFKVIGCVIYWLIAIACFSVLVVNSSADIRLASAWGMVISAITAYLLISQ